MAAAEPAARAGDILTLEIAGFVANYIFTITRFGNFYAQAHIQP